MIHYNDLPVIRTLTFLGKNRDLKYRLSSEMYGIFPDIHVRGDPSTYAPLPWRLSSRDIRVVDQRVRQICWPHMVQPLANLQTSFWLKKAFIEKTACKSLALKVIRYE